MLDVQAFFGLGEGNALADVPQLVRLGKVLGHHGVGHAAHFKRGLQQRLESSAGVLFGFAVGVFEQHTPRRVVVAQKRHAQLWHVFAHQAQRKLAHHLKARKACAQLLVCQTQQSHSVFHRRHSRPRGEVGGGLGVELHRRGGDDAERAFAADEKVAQVVARVVLAQALEAVPHLALRRDDFEAQAQVARVAVAHHLCAARIGAQVAADGATAFGCEAQGEEHASLLGLVLQVLQDAARFHSHGQVVGVHVAHRVHACEAQHDLRAAVIGRRAHGKARVAALGHDGGARCRAGLDHGGHFLRVGGAHHGQGLAAHAAAPVLFPGGQVAFVEHMGGADDGAQGVEQGGHG